LPADSRVEERREGVSAIPIGRLANVQIDGTKTPVTCSETVIDDHAVNVMATVNGQINTKVSDA
jgi:hypothetical protein